MHTTPSARPSRSWRRLPWLAAVLLIWVATALPSIAQAAIDGTLRLADGDVAPPGGLYVDVYADNQTSPYNRVSDSLYIAEGLSAADYSLNMPPSATASWRLSYNCTYGCDGYFTTGYYADGGTTLDYYQATLLPGDVNHTDKDLTLIAGNIVDGTVQLPNGDVAPAGGLSLEVYAYNSLSPYYYVSSSLFIAEGLSAVDYSLLVPPDSGAEWFVAYSCWGCADSGYLVYGYYADGGTTWDSSQATVLAGGIDHLGKDITLIPGNIIAGTVRLPNGDVAPAGGLYLYVDAYDQYGAIYNWAYVFIDEGLSAADYSLTVGPDPNTSWVVRYSCSNCSDYLYPGYYADGGTTWDYAQATLLAGGIDHLGTDLTLLTGNIIGGTVQLPNGDVAPAGGLYLYVSAYDQYGGSYYSAYVFIDEGLSAVDYSLHVVPDPNASWLVSYSWCCGANYLNYGYYADGGTTWDYAQATLLAGGIDHLGTDLTLITGNIIGGTVRLPSGDVAPAGGLYLSVYAFDQSGSWYYVSSSVFIAEGLSAADYSLHVAPDPNAGWLVGYSCGCGANYLNYGYYADGGTTWDYAQATLLAGGIDHSGKDLRLLYSESLTVDFGTSGLWTHHGSSWVKRSSWNAGSGGLTDWSGGLAVDFDDKGIWSHDGSAWLRLSTWDVGDGMTGWFGGLAVDFDANGLWNRNGPTWTRLTTWNAEALASWSGGLAADFGTNGLWSYDGSSWRKLSGWNAGSGGLSGWSGGLAADFDGNGLWSHDGTSWRKLSGWDAGSGGLSGWSGGLAADFDGNGLWSHDGTSWRKLSSWDAGSGGLSGWSGGLAADFDANGLWRYDGTSWRKVSGWNAEGMAAGLY